MVEAVFQFSGVADGELCSNSEGSINFQALRAGASESGILGKNDVSAVLADPKVIGHRVHGMELPADNTIGTTKFFIGHVGDAQPAGVRRPHGNYNLCPGSSMFDDCRGIEEPPQAQP